jgi:GNAT superfamily N-acetyltransferase
MPQGHLDAIDEGARAERWHRYLAEGAVGMLVVERDSDVLGFAVTTQGPADRAGLAPDTDPDVDTDADRVTDQPEKAASEAMVSAFYVRPLVWGTGAAQVLMGGSERVMSAEGFSRARLSVLAGNLRARRFYEKAGWSTDGRELSHEAHQPGMPGPVTVDVVEYTKVLSRPGQGSGAASPGRRLGR